MRFLVDLKVMNTNYFNLPKRKCKLIISFSVVELNSNITMERNGSMPNLSSTGSRVPVDKTMKLRFAYDKYLSSLEAKYTFQVTEKKITSNINEQTDVFRGEFDFLKKQLVTLTEELKLINEFKIEKENLDKKLEILEMLCKYIFIYVFNKIKYC